MVETVCSSHTRQECFHVNVRYLPLKILYFVYLAGQAASLVFQSVYMRHLGLSTKQTGVLWAVHRLVGVVATPLTGAIADKTGKSKTALCTLLACSAIVAASMAFVPIEAQNTTLKIARCYITNQTAQAVLPPGLNRSLCKLFPVLQPWNVCNISLPTEYDFGQNLTETNNIYYVEMVHLVANVHDSCHFENHNGRPVTCILPNSTSGSNFPRCAKVDVKSTDADRYGVTFWSMACLMLLASFFYTGCMPLIDASAFTILGENNRNKFGHQRLFGSLGFGSISFLVGVIKNSISSNMADPSSSNLPFYPAFFGALFFWLTSAAVASKLAISNSKSQPIVLANIKNILRDKKVISFLVFIALPYGSAHAAAISYEFWLLEEKLKTSSFVFGLASLCGSLSDIPCYLLSGYFIKRFGHRVMMVFGLLVYALRFLLFTLINEPWQIIPADFLFGITWGMTWAVICGYTARISPPELQYTTMAIVQTITHGFGWSVGALLGGYMFEIMGGDLMFRTMALAVTICSFVYSVLSFYFNKTTKKVVRTASPKTPPELMEMEELVTGN